MKIRLNNRKYFKNVSKFSRFLDHFSVYESTRTSGSLRAIFNLALDDLNGLDDMIFQNSGFHPSIILKALFSLAEEWGEIFRISEDHVDVRSLGFVSKTFCEIPIDFTSDYCCDILKRKGINNFEKILSSVTLNSSNAEKYIQSWKTRKRNEKIFMYNYPLWDHPLLRVDQDYMSNITLFVQSFQELAFRFISSSTSALATFVDKEHGKLVKKVCSILEEEGFKNIKIKKKFVEKGIQKAEFDVIAAKGQSILHVECKTRRMPWRARMYLNPMELEKEALDYIEDNKLSEKTWKKKLGYLEKYIQTLPECKKGKLISIIVTDMPTPASDICKHAKILWIAHLKDYIHRVQ